MRDVIIHNQKFTVQDNECKKIDNSAYYPLELRENISSLDREIGFIKSLTVFSDIFTNIMYRFGGYVPKNLASYYKYIYASGTFSEPNIYPYESVNQGEILRIEPSYILDITNKYIIIISDYIGNIQEYICLSWFEDRHVYIHNSIWEKFYNRYKNFISETTFSYDNLVHLLIMVKNAGENFASILKENLPYFDYYTILDTGSTDNTINIIKEIFKDKDGRIFEEPFINFRESRNRLLELAGHDYAFNIMLDDTYILKGDIRSFLTLARSDDKMDSYSLYIKNPDVLYSSNRITKPEKNLRYIYTIHEIIEKNNNGAIPIDLAWIDDITCPYMTERTKERKKKDLELLLEERKSNPDDCRITYYIAETYLCMEMWLEAFNYYSIRAMELGFEQEIQDSLYKKAVLAYNNLNIPWEKCHQYYLDCFEFDSSRPESIFMIGKTLVEQQNKKKSGFLYLKHAFNIGIPINTMNSRVKIYAYYLPNILLKLCYEMKNDLLGLQCAQRIISNNFSDNYTYEWLRIFQLLQSIPVVIHSPVNTIPYVCFVIDGGWQAWSGQTYYDYGLGGSETFVVKYAEYFQLIGIPTVVFCNCQQYTVYNGVQYYPLEKYMEFLVNNTIKICIVNRYPIYTHIPIRLNIPTYLVLHDLLSQDDIIPQKVKYVMCISDWHKEYFDSVFLGFSHKSKVISYGINTSLFSKQKKIPNTFIYPSFPNRGLLSLLQMFPKITEEFPDSILHVFCDTKHKWVQQFHKQEMDLIDTLLDEQKNNVINHGWVNGEILRKYWSVCQIWFYPCTFAETCCLTAYEAMASGTLIITNHFAALRDTVSDRGIIVPGNPKENGWKILAVNRVLNVLRGVENPEKYITKGLDWIQSKNFEKVIPDFIEKYFV